ncbi:DUF2254 domain-containing protein [Microbulbifer sp. CnH-101-G]|uniref:DUF2254 domain-containing protein n=1 Tax=Microbulbifer sp. CnH-101-G TaxID=3243393 RepID=UPI00403A4F71
MKKHFLHLYEKLRSSFWSVPLIMILSALLLAYMMRQLDALLSTLPLFETGQITTLDWLHMRDVNSARALLSVIAGSTITVAGTVFSITVVALTLASNQFGPHLIRNFIRDRSTQSSLGIFLSTYVYALVTMRSIEGTTGDITTYGFAIQIALLLTLISIGYLVYFIHNVAQSIQVDNIAHQINLEFHQAIDREYPSSAESDKGEHFDTERLELGASWIPVPTPRGGYVQIIDREKIIAIAEKFNCCVQISCHPGSYVHNWGQIGRIYQNADSEEIIPQVQSALKIGALPTAEQDIVFSMRQLSQIAVRALSPGINDPFTAYSCVDRLIEGLGTVLQRPEPANCFTGSAGALRLVSCKLEFAQLLNASLDEIVEHGRANGVFMRHLLNALDHLAEVCQRQKDKVALFNYLQRLANDIEIFIKSETDSNQILEIISAIQKKLTA